MPSRVPAWTMATALAMVITAGTLPAEAPDKPRNILACRLASYYQYEDQSLPHIAACGFKYVFKGIVPPDQLDATKKRLAKYGLKVVVLRADANLGNSFSVDQLAEQLATCEKMGVKYLFLNPLHTGVSKDVAIERLKKVGEIAKKHGVIVTLETHPDLGTNGDVHLETMRRINHPNIRVNFDTGNITHYNQGRDAVTELEKCIDYVATVEVKDHDGKYASHLFLPLGTGVVDFPAILKLLKEHGYQGPITLDQEGGESTKEQIEKDVSASAKYLRSLGDFD